MNSDDPSVIVGFIAVKLLISPRRSSAALSASEGALPGGTSAASGSYRAISASASPAFIALPNISCSSLGL